MKSHCSMTRKKPLSFYFLVNYNEYFPPMLNLKRLIINLEENQTILVSKNERSIYMLKLEYDYFIICNYIMYSRVRAETAYY